MFVNGSDDINEFFDLLVALVDRILNAISGIDQDNSRRSDLGYDTINYELSITVGWWK